MPFKKQQILFFFHIKLRIKRLLMIENGDDGQFLFFIGLC
ncbi:hypothetical protein BOVA711_2614 [Bacteroides ovatus]|nr:hypothetical protein BOVA711_2614 [Bacteroides ovatus]CAG9912022.1 hypothetical protein BOVA172_2718 [Bacteroides ovatus]